MDHRPQVSQQDGVTIVVFGPDLASITEDRIPAISEAMLTVADADPPRVVIDLSAVEFFSSSFIEVIFRLWNRVHRRPEGRMALCGLTKYCLEVLQVTNLDELWEIFPDRDSALAALRPDQ